MKHFINGINGIKGESQMQSLREKKHKCHMLKVFFFVIFCKCIYFIFLTSIWSTMIQDFDKMLNGKQGCEHILQQMLHNLTSP